MSLPAEERAAHDTSWPAAIVALTFLGLGGWFLWGPSDPGFPGAVPGTIEPDRLTTAPPRRVLGDPPTIEIDGEPRSCMDCHSLFQASPEAPLKPVLHAHIQLNHGINDRCRNCHHIENRDKLVLHGGTVVSYSESHLLCAKCHGPIYRDWETGAHGRTNGYWAASRGEVRRLKCSHCHDPHDPMVPAMVPIRPLPGPRGPGPQTHDHDASKESEKPQRDPLNVR